MRFFIYPLPPKGGKKSPSGDLEVLTLKIKLYEKEIFIFVVICIITSTGSFARYATMAEAMREL